MDSFRTDTTSTLQSFLYGNTLGVYTGLSSVFPHGVKFSAMSAGMLVLTLPFSRKRNIFQNNLLSWKKGLSWSQTKKWLSMPFSISGSLGKRTLFHFFRYLQHKRLASCSCHFPMFIFVRVVTKLVADVITENRARPRLCPLQRRPSAVKPPVRVAMKQSH